MPLTKYRLGIGLGTYVCNDGDSTENKCTFVDTDQVTINTKSGAQRMFGSEDELGQLASKDVGSAMCKRNLECLMPGKSCVALNAYGQEIPGSGPCALGKGRCTWLGVCAQNKESVPLQLKKDQRVTDCEQESDCKKPYRQCEGRKKGQTLPCATARNEAHCVKSGIGRKSCKFAPGLFNQQK